MTTSPKSAPATDFPPYKWDDITLKLCLASSKEIPKFILASSFLEPWVQFRDLLPLKPGVAVPVIAPKDKDAMNDLITIIYNAMDCMATSKYDRPTYVERKLWEPNEFIECLIYQSARNLAREGHTFHAHFLRPNLKNEAGRKEAFHRLRGLVMLISNLTLNYTLMQPSNVIRRIEAARPAKNPNLSPIVEVRVKWQLDHMEVDELRKKVLDSERKGKEEKEWLIGILMGKEVGPRVAEMGTASDKVVGVKKEGSIEVASMKRAGSAVDDMVIKRSRTVG